MLARQWLQSIQEQSITHGRRHEGNGECRDRNEAAEVEEQKAMAVEGNRWRAHDLERSGGEQEA